MKVIFESKKQFKYNDGIVLDSNSIMKFLNFVTQDK